MHVKTSSKKGMLKAEFEGELGIYAAQDLHRLLTEALNKADHFTIDLNKVQEIDTTALQLLIMAKRAFTEAGKSLSLTMSGPAIIEALELYGLRETLGN